MLKLKLNKITVKKLLKGINNESHIRIMEVCGTHTMAIAKAGIKQLLPANIELISGPGCPVCVTAQEDIERILILAKKREVIITTFGDMLRVPGSTGSLQEMQAQGADVRIVYSPLDAVNLARNNPEKEIVFLAVGFETTTPTVAFALEDAHKTGVDNFSIVCMHKLVIPALKALLSDQETEIHGFLLPGHVSTIIGTIPYEFIPREYQRACVVSGFEPGDILESILFISRQLENADYKVENQYKRGVKTEGNKIALEIMDKYFTPFNSLWRGMGEIKDSGLRLRPEYVQYDAIFKFGLQDTLVQLAPSGCICGNILKGILKPEECALFSKMCTPAFPVGPCMVSSEGACAASYYYAGGEVIGR
ncbi:MAG: hydrogenase assembly protein HupF [Clostridiaceae bacterium BRH_c20a]|nr:MAG: hydrogenase assembly protein HupF [Clostridiaceae bacterium BRH_c20a]